VSMCPCNRETADVPKENVAVAVARWTLRSCRYRCCSTSALPVITPVLGSISTTYYHYSSKRHQS